MGGGGRGARMRRTLSRACTSTASNSNNVEAVEDLGSEDGFDTDENVSASGSVPRVRSFFVVNPKIFVMW